MIQGFIWVSCFVSSLKRLHPTELTKHVEIVLSQSRPSSKYTSIFNNNKNKSLTYENTLYFFYFTLLFFFSSKNISTRKQFSFFKLVRESQKSFHDRWNILPLTFNLYIAKKEVITNLTVKMKSFDGSTSLSLVKIFNLFNFFLGICVINMKDKGYK